MLLSQLSSVCMRRCLCQQLSRGLRTAKVQNLGLKSPSLRLYPQTKVTKSGWRSYSHQIVEGDKGTYKPTPFQKRVLVWTKTYPSVEEVPERIKRMQMKTAMDKFRVKATMYMIAATLIGAAIMAFFGRKQRLDGYSVKEEVLAKRRKLREDHLKKEDSP